MKKYRCLYNEDIGCVSLVATPECPTRDHPVTRAHVERFVKDAENTAVDAFLCCPVDLRIPFWHSKARPFWEEPRARFESVPGGMTSSQLNIYRARDYILSGGEPILETYDAVKKAGMDFFFSLRMNDWHYIDEVNAENAAQYPTVDRFYIDHPEYRIGTLNASNRVGWKRKNPYEQNYLIPEVREHYLALAAELIGLCNIDGFELDFMRSPNYFPEDKIAEGTPVMTEFIRKIRKMLDEAGEKHSKHIPLCLHMPHKYEYCAALGFDLETLTDEGTVQMINVTSSYFHNAALDIETFKRRLPKAQIYGEIQEVICKTKTDGVQTERKMTAELYRSTAQSILKRGADGIALFNYQFLRPMIYEDHDSPDAVTDSTTLIGLTDTDFLERCAKLYAITEYGQPGEELPATGRTEITFTVDEDDPAKHTGAKLRLLFENSVDGKKIDVCFNGVGLCEADDNDELFPPISTAGLLPPDRTRNFTVSPETVSKNNRVEIRLGDAVLFAAELALY